MQNLELEYLINKYLNIELYQDNVPNGLQVEGCLNIQNIITGVTASQALLNKAVELNVDAIIVHHGYFWNNESPVIVNMKRNRLKTLLYHNINLYSYHLPLDIHPIVGNNVQLGNILGIKIKKYIKPLLPIGKFLKSISINNLSTLLNNKLSRMPLYCGNNNNNNIKTISWCTGNGQHFIPIAAKNGADGFITGEISEPTFHIAKEMNINCFIAGHHATEKFGIQALGSWLQKEYDLFVTFVDIHNPV